MYQFLTKHGKSGGMKENYKKNAKKPYKKWEKTYRDIYACVTDLSHLELSLVAINDKDTVVTNLSSYELTAEQKDCCPLDCSSS